MRSYAKDFNMPLKSLITKCDEIADSFQLFNALQVLKLLFELFLFIIGLGKGYTLADVLFSLVFINILIVEPVITFLIVGYLEADAIHIREKLRNQAIKF
jgi:hypothetical protein